MKLKRNDAEGLSADAQRIAPPRPDAVSEARNVTSLAAFQASRRTQEREAARADALRRVLSNAEKLTW